jgi:hypothetical protein
MWGDPHLVHLPLKIEYHSSCDFQAAVMTTMVSSLLSPIEIAPFVVMH